MIDFIKFKSRGVGMDVIGKCFVCGCRTPGVTPNIAAFVDSKEDGEVVVSFFREGSARLDYRDFEPNWIQVKIGACEKHEPCLEELTALTRHGTIRERDILLASLIPPKEKINESKK